MIPGGIRQDTSPVERDGFLELQNTTRKYSDALSRRPGLANKVNVGAHAVTDMTYNGSQYVVRINREKTKIESNSIEYGATNVAQKTLTSTFAGAKNPFYKYDKYVFVCTSDATDGVQRIDNPASGTALPAGISAPSGTIGTPTQGSGSVTEGVHLFRYRYYDSATGYFSNPSGTLSVTMAASSTAVFDIGTSGTDIIRSTDGKVDQILVEMTTANGSVFYDAALVDQTEASVTIDLDDLTLEVQPRRAFGADTGHAPPPTDLLFATPHNGRIFGVRSSDRAKVFWTTAGYPEGWDTISYGRTISADGDSITGMASVFGDLYIFCTRSTYRLNFQSDPAAGSLEQIPGSPGLSTNAALVKAGGVLYGHGSESIWALTSMVPRIISDPVRETLRSDDTTVNFAVAHETDDVVMFFAKTDSATTDGESDTAITYHYGSGEWSTRTFGKPIEAGCAINALNGENACFLSDGVGTAGYSHTMLESALYDGVCPVSCPIYTVAAGSTTTTVNVDSALPVTQTLESVYVYRPATGESSYITSVNATDFTVNDAFATAPAAGEEVYFGAPDLVIGWKWSRNGQGNDRSRPRNLNILFDTLTSTDTATCELRRYKDFGSNPITLTKGVFDTPRDGVAITNGDTKATLYLNGGDDGNGHVNAQLGSEFVRFHRYEITHNRPDGEFTIIDMDLDQERNDVKKDYQS